MIKIKLVIFILFLCGTMFAAGRQEAVDVEICVVDSMTGMPLQNISIIYMLKKVKNFIVDGTFTIIESTQYTTDENGVFKIPKSRVPSLKFYEKLYAAYFYINIDLEEKYKSQALDYQHFDLNINFLNNFAIRHVFPSSDYYSARIVLFFQDGERMIYTQINDDKDVKKRIQRKSYTAQKGEKERIIVELVRRPITTTGTE